MHPKLFNQSFLNTAGLCVFIGLVLGSAVARYYARVKNANQEYARFLEWNAYMAIVFAFVPGIGLEAVYHYIENPSAGFHLTHGVTFFGGLIGGFTAFVVGYFVFVRRRFGPRFVEALPVMPVCITIAHACGRIGCFLGGCCYGKPTESFLGVRFPNLGYKALPTQLFEAAFLFVLFAVLFHLAVRKSFKQTFALYMLSYGTFRFFVEYFRDDDRGRLVGTLSPSQSISLLMVAGSVAMYFTMEHLLREYHRNPNITGKIFPAPR